MGGGYRTETRLGSSARRSAVSAYIPKLDWYRLLDPECVRLAIGAGPGLADPSATAGGGSQSVGQAAGQ